MAGWRSSTSSTTPARSPRERCSAACPEPVPTATTTPRPRSRPVRWPCWSSGRWTCRCPRCGSPTVAPAMAFARRGLLRAPVAVAVRRRHHRHQRQDHHHPPPAQRPGGRRSPHGGARHALGRPHHPRGAGAAAHVGPLARRRRGGRGHGGLVARPRAPPGGRHPLRRGRVHQPEPGPPRLPRLDGGVLRGQGPPVRARRCPSVVSSTSTARTAGCSPTPRRYPPRRYSMAEAEDLAARRHGLVASPGGVIRCALPLGGALQRRQRPRRGPRGRPRWASTTPPSPTGLSRRLVVPGRFELVEAGQPFPVVVDYAHTPDGLDQLLAAADDLTTEGPDGEPGRVLVVFGCGGDRDATKRPAMGEVAASRADLVVVTADNSRHEDTSAIIEAVKQGFERVHPRRAAELRGRARPPRRHRRRPRRRRASATWCWWPARATRRPRTSVASSRRSTTGWSSPRSGPGTGGAA